MPICRTAKGADKNAFAANRLDIIAKLSHAYLEKLISMYMSLFYTHDYVYNTEAVLYI